MKELYNRRHAGARNVIERTFGVIQARFKILTTGFHFDTQTQADLFPALAVIHNIIRKQDPDNDLAAHPPVLGDERDDDSNEYHAATTAAARAAAAARDHVAKKMWDKYSTASM